MSKRGIPISFTSKQKEIVARFLGNRASEVFIPNKVGILMRYGILPPQTKVKPNVLILTPEQKNLLKKEFKVTCDFIELTKEMTFR